MLSSFVFSGSRWKVQTPLSRLDKHVLYNCMRSASKNSIGDAAPNQAMGLDWFRTVFGNNLQF